jgi:hypothetical protein
MPEGIADNVVTPKPIPFVRIPKWTSPVAEPTATALPSSSSLLSTSTSSSTTTTSTTISSSSLHAPIDDGWIVIAQSQLTQ